MFWICISASKGHSVYCLPASGWHWGPLSRAKYLVLGTCTDCFKGFTYTINVFLLAKIKINIQTNKKYFYSSGCYFVSWREEHRLGFRFCLIVDVHQQLLISSKEAQPCYPIITASNHWLPQGKAWKWAYWHTVFILILDFF